MKSKVFEDLKKPFGFILYICKENLKDNGR